MQVEGEIHANPIANHAGWLRGPRRPSLGNLISGQGLFVVQVMLDIA